MVAFEQDPFEGTHSTTTACKAATKSIRSRTLGADDRVRDVRASSMLAEVYGEQLCASVRARSQRSQAEIRSAQRGIADLPGEHVYCLVWQQACKALRCLLVRIDDDHGVCALEKAMVTTAATTEFSSRVSVDHSQQQQSSRSDVALSKARTCKSARCG